MIRAKKVKQFIPEVLQILSSCTLCERKCKVNRLQGECGYCGLLEESFLFKNFIHLGEEGGLSPSYTVYLSGCNMHCGYCNNMEYIKKPILNTSCNIKELAGQIDNGLKQSKNVNFLGGEPTVNLLTIIKIISMMESDSPIVWNSNMYGSEESMKIIDSFTDVYLADFKFGNNECSIGIADSDNYFETITRNLLSINPKRRIIIRHLPLPGHLNCCSKPILKWISQNLPKVECSIISALIPNTKFPTSINDSEHLELITFAKELGVNIISPPSFPRSIEEVERNKEKIETTIVIRPDGSIIFQDLNRDMATLATNI